MPIVPNRVLGEGFIIIKGLFESRIYFVVRLNTSGGHAGEYKLEVIERFPLKVKSLTPGFWPTASERAAVARLYDEIVSAEWNLKL